ncbi:MAG: ABC transporter ATP-binding protein [Desulfobacteraceae bacterium]|nr:ABC transporter ATP-binding protein [Desulfobacteraceae bacterium]
MSELLNVKNLKTYFFTKYGTVKAVDGVSFKVDKGETFGIVGESGCGKSITALSIMRLVPDPPGRIVGGEIVLEGEDILKISDNEMRKVRGKKISMILQDPMTSLNPVFTIGIQLEEAIKIHQGLKGRSLRERAIELLEMVQISSAAVRYKNWPHQLSGGMRQRVIGAISVSSEPRLLIADEPTTALDATIQVQFLRLLRELQEKTGVGLVFITHDFGIIARMCQRAAVMYAGRIVETGSVRDLFDNPSHPYTAALMRSLPKLEEKVERLASIEGQPPPLNDDIQGCRFAERCTVAEHQCRLSYPDETEISDGHFVSCWKF